MLPKWLFVLSSLFLKQKSDRPVLPGPICPPPPFLFNKRWSSVQHERLIHSTSCCWTDHGKQFLTLRMTSFLFRVFLFNRKIHFCRLVFGHLSLLLIFFVTSWCKFHFCVDLTNYCSTTNYWDGLLSNQKKCFAHTKYFDFFYSMYCRLRLQRVKTRLFGDKNKRKCWREKTKLQRNAPF